MKSITVTLIPAVLKWARERASLEISALAHSLKINDETVIEWEKTGKIKQSLIRKLASKTRTPEGFLYLSAPLNDNLPIPDFRTIKSNSTIKPSPDLLETIQTMELRQDWMRDYLTDIGIGELNFVGCIKNAKKADAQNIADQIRKRLGLSDNWAKEKKTLEDALSFLRTKIEDIGILIFINGIVGNNTHRTLIPAEFRGFTLCDSISPLIFINGKDSKSAQMFTIAHELAHLWLGKEGVTNSDESRIPGDEDVCDAIAAEFLIPQTELLKIWNGKISFDSIARYFKSSIIVAARRCLNLQLITRQQFFDFYEEYKKELLNIPKKASGSGGDFWNSNNYRIGVRFGVTVAIAAKEGKISYRDAYRLTNLSSNAFETYSKSIGISI